MTNENKLSFDEVKARLDEIVDAVSEEDIMLDDALSLYEEAIKLGMQVSNILEEDISAEQVEKTIDALNVIDSENAAAENNGSEKDVDGGEFNQEPSSVVDESADNEELTLEDEAIASENEADNDAVAGSEEEVDA